MKTVIEVDQCFFDSVEEIQADIKKHDLYGGENEFDAAPSGGTPLHWHAIGLYVYITDGKFRFQDPATGEIHECVKGTRFVIPERALHIEEEHNGYKGYLGMKREVFPQNFVRDPDELKDLAPLEAEVKTETQEA